MLNPGFVAEFGGRILVQTPENVQKIVKRKRKINFDTKVPYRTA
jgi:hypothetical protein